MKSQLLASAVLMITVIGCSSDDQPGEAEVPRPDDAVALAARDACQFKAGALPQDTLGKSDPIAKRIPVDHIFVLMMENRSFDHYFSKLPEYGVTDVTVADDSFSNVDDTGKSVKWFHETEYCVEDPSHGWGGSHRQWNTGKNDGFVLDNEPNGRRAMGYFDGSDLPFYYALAKEFSIGDGYFCSLLGPTWPNRMYLYSASSHGLTENTLPTLKVANIFAALNEKKIEWKVYRSNLPPAAMFVETWLESIQGCGTGDGPCRVANIDDLEADLASGDLPPVVFVDPEYSTGILETSEHPPGNPHHGQRFTWRVVDALTKSPVWKRSALFITYDEHGGFADHVAPPPACHPGDAEPDETKHGTFDRFGFRVPLMVVSPFAKKGYVSHQVRDHTAILRFIQARHGIGAFSNRDANSDALMDLFDFEAAPHATPPSFPEPAVDPAKVTACAAAFPGGK